MERFGKAVGDVNWVLVLVKYLGNLANEAFCSCPRLRTLV